MTGSAKNIRWLFCLFLVSHNDLLIVFLMILKLFNITQRGCTWPQKQWASLWVRHCQSKCEPAIGHLWFKNQMSSGMDHNVSMSLLMHIVKCTQVWMGFLWKLCCYKSTELSHWWHHSDLMYLWSALESKQWALSTEPAAWPGIASDLHLLRLTIIGWLHWLNWQFYLNVTGCSAVCPSKRCSLCS